MEKLSVLCLFFALSLSFACGGAENDLYSNSDPTLENGVSWMFYKSTCPKLESIVDKLDIIQAAGLPRLQFHDCFVQGCDGTVVLDGSANWLSEQDVPPNLMLRGKAFEDVDKACDALVSCILMAPITALATRDSVSRVCGMISATQNPESGKNTNKWLQSARVESFTVMCKGLIDGRAENLWASQCKRFSEQTSESTMDRVFKGRTLLEPPEPKPDPGHAAHHH